MKPSDVWLRHILKCVLIRLVLMMLGVADMGKKLHEIAAKIRKRSISSKDRHQVVRKSKERLAQSEKMSCRLSVVAAIAAA
jgi:hypothetical protein